MVLHSQRHRRPRNQVARFVMAEWRGPPSAAGLARNSFGAIEAEVGGSRCAL
jgi:hypothetical protein